MPNRGGTFNLVIKKLWTDITHKRTVVLFLWVANTAVPMQTPNSSCPKQYESPQILKFPWTLFCLLLLLCYCCCFLQSKNIYTIQELRKKTAWYKFILCLFSQWNCLPEFASRCFKMMLKFCCFSWIMYYTKLALASPFKNVPNPLLDKSLPSSFQCCIVVKLEMHRIGLLYL